MANGRFSWTEDTITLQDVTIRWEDFDENTQKKLLPKSVSIDGPDIFHYVDTLDQTDVQPDKIELSLPNTISVVHPANGNIFPLII